MIEKNNFNEIEGKEILNKLFNKELNSKKIYIRSYRNNKTIG